MGLAMDRRAFGGGITRFLEDASRRPNDRISLDPIEAAVSRRDGGVDLQEDYEDNARAS